MRGVDKVLLYQSIAVTAAFTISSHGTFRSFLGREQPQAVREPIFRKEDRIHGGGTLLSAKDDDVNDLFAAYMAQRKDKPMYSEPEPPANYDEASTSASASNSPEENPPEPPKKQKRWTPGQRLRNYLYSTGAVDEPNFVKPISLGQPKGLTEDASTLPPNPPSLLQKGDIESINENIETFSNEMESKLDELSIENPGSLPPNAKEILDEIVEQQRTHEIEEKTQQRALESFGEYQERMREQLKTMQENSELAVNDNPVVKEIVEEAQKIHEVSEKRQEDIKIFQEYEESLKNDLKRRSEDAELYFANAASANPDSAQSGNGGSTSSFEEQQLKILEELLERRNQAAETGGFDDEDIYLTDNIEDGINELRQKIAQNSSSQGFEKPESLKEWQMYRSIATKLANENKDGEGNGNVSSDDGQVDFNLENQLSQDSEEIQSKMQAWKDFQIKEDEMRDKSGLTIKYRPPFEWSNRPDNTGKEAPQARKRGPIDREKAEEAKTEFDDLALGVLEELMGKTQDASRKEKLRNEIVELKEGIKKRQEYLKKRGPEVIQVKKVVPITIGEALRSPSKPKRRVKKVVKEDKPVAIESIEPEVPISENEDDYNVDNSIYEIEEEAVEDETPPPPDSDFFREIEEDVDSISLIEDEKEFEDDSDVNDEEVVSLGTLEEQKFRSLVARSGVRDVEGKNELKQQWEEFQMAENAMREKAGLNAGSKSTGVTEPLPTPKVDYDVNAMFKEDGDIDFDQIFSSIGTRPSRKKKGKAGSNEPAPTAPAVVESPPPVIEYDMGDEMPAVVESPPPVIEYDMGDEMPERISAVRNTDSVIDETPAVQNTDTAKIPEEVEEIDQNKTEERTETPTPQPQRGSLTFGVEVKQPVGFDERKASLLQKRRLSVSQIDNLVALKSAKFASKASPYLAKMNKPFREYGAIFSLEGVLVDITGFQYDIWSQVATTYDFEIPTVEDVQFASVHKEEFAIQRIFYWTDDVFTARKIGETFREVRNSVFEKWLETSIAEAEAEEPETSNSMGFEVPGPTKEEVAAASKAENDILEIQFLAWERAAKSYGFRAPSRDLLNVVGTMQPDEAVRVVFNWTKDFLVSNDVGNAYRKYWKEETKKWISKGGVAPTVAVPRKEFDSLIPKEEEKKPYSPTSDDILNLKRKAWESAVNSSGVNLTPPTMDEIQVIEFAGLEKAPSIFKWNTTPEQFNSIVNIYREELKTLTQELISKVEDEIASEETPEEDEDSVLDLKPFALKPGVQSWLSALVDINVPCAIISDMERDVVNKILNRMNLSHFFPEENRICSNAEYDSDLQKMLGGALRLERRPDHCVVFSATPQSALACTEAEMKNVAIVNPYPFYELTRADMTVRDFGSIGIRNLKNIFSVVATEEPLEQVEVEGPRIGRVTMLKTRYWDEDDDYDYR